MTNRIHLAFVRLEELSGTLSGFEDLVKDAIDAQFGDVSCFGDLELHIMFSDGLLEVYVDP